MASASDNPHEPNLPSPSVVSANESSRAKSIATRLTEAEFAELDAAAANAGKKMAEWLRDAALPHARAGQEQTDPILARGCYAFQARALHMRAIVMQAKAMEWKPLRLVSSRS
jgi:hypothetical protein